MNQVRLPEVIMNRRQFLASGAFAGLTVATSCSTRPAAAGTRGDIIDTHTHFYDPSRPQGVPWPPKDDPVLSRPILPAEFEMLARPQGVIGTVVVEASPWVEDNQWLLQLADQNPYILGVVGNLQPGSPEFGTHLNRFSRNRLFRGIRIGDERLQAALQPGAARDDLKRLADLDLTLDLLIPPEHLPGAAQLSEAIPNLRIVVDHCANVPVGSLPPNDWTGGLSACHYTPNVFMKVSGLVEGTGRRGGAAPTDPAHYTGIIDAVWHPFGPDRLLFGSNWPVCLHFANYATTLRIVESYFNHHGSGAARRYFHTNALRVYKVAARR